MARRSHCPLLLGTSQSVFSLHALFCMRATTSVVRFDDEVSQAMNGWHAVTERLCTLFQVGAVLPRDPADIPAGTQLHAGVSLGYISRMCSAAAFVNQIRRATSHRPVVRCFRCDNVGLLDAMPESRGVSYDSVHGVVYAACEGGVISVSGTTVTTVASSTQCPSPERCVVRQRARSGVCCMLPVAASSA